MFWWDFSIFWLDTRYPYPSLISFMYCFQSILPILWSCLYCPDFASFCKQQSIKITNTAYFSEFLGSVFVWHAYHSTCFQVLVISRLCFCMELLCPLCRTLYLSLFKFRRFLSVCFWQTVMLVSGSPALHVFTTPPNLVSSRNLLKVHFLPFARLLTLLGGACHGISPCKHNS